MIVSTVQMPIEDGNCEVNRITLARILDKNPGADLYLAPELWSTGYTVSKWPVLAEKDTPNTVMWMSEQAKLREIWFAGSVIHTHLDGGITNRFVLFNRSGELVGYYDKSHPFLPMGESVLVPGNQIPIFDIEGVRTAPSICYDLRFPEMYRRLALQNVDLFLVPSEWPCPREVPLIVLASARAIENQAFLLLSNRTAFDVDRQKFCGRSGLFGPLGTIGMMAEDKVGAMTFNLDFQLLSGSREKLHIFSERRLGVDYE